MIKKAYLGLLLCFILLFTTGCWNNRTLNDMNFATAVGFDKDEAGKIEVTVQLAKVSALGQDKTSGEEAVWVYSNSGETVFEALRGMLTTVSRKIFVGHINLVVFDEQLAKDGIIDILDIFARDYEVNRKAKVLIAKGMKAKEVLEAKSDFEDISALHIVDVLQNNSAYAKIKNIELFDLLSFHSLSGFSPTVGVIQPTIKKSEKLQVKDLKIQGTAIFKKNGLTGWLEPSATRGLLFVLGEVKSGIINVTNPQDKDEKIAFEIIKAKVEKKTQLKKGRPSFVIKISAEGRIGEQHGEMDFISQKGREKLETKVEKVIKTDIKKAVTLAQKKYQSDILGFGQLIYKQQPEYWQEINEDWAQIFSQSAVKIKVDWKTINSGLYQSKPKAK